MIWALLQKDCANLKNSLLPAVFLGLPLILILGLSSQEPELGSVPWQTAFWVVFFISLNALFYRSFEQENRSRNYSLYFSLKVPRLLIFFSQVSLQLVAAISLAGLLLVLVTIFWSPSEFPLATWLWASLAALALSPLGCLLGLLLQWERDFLFALFFLPLASPVLMAGFQLSFEFQAPWLYILLIFCLVSSFLSALLFDFFFDELVESH